MGSPNEYTVCPACNVLVGTTAFECPQCGIDMDFALEMKRQVRSTLRFMSAALIGVVLVSAIVLFAFGIVQQYPKLVVPLWIASTSLGIAFWLIGDTLGKGSNERASN